MSKRDMISICDVNKEEALEIFEIAKRLKAGVKKGDFPPLLEKRCLAMIFEKPSLQTRCSFEVGMFQLGGHAVYLQPSDIGLGTRESVYDVAKNIERWFNIALARVFKNQTVAELARHASIPVINALCDVEHPCQAFADFMTILEHRGKFEGFRLAYIGDGNNVCHSLVLLSALLGTHINVSSPEGFEPQKAIIEKAANMCKKSGGSYNFFRNPADAVKNAEAIYTDVWASMGQELEAENRKKIFFPYQVNKALVSNAPSGVWIMHDMPAHRGEEITDDVIDSKNSIVFDQAENRLHAQKGIIVFLSR